MPSSNYATRRSTSHAANKKTAAPVVVKKSTAPPAAAPPISPPPALAGTVGAAAYAVAVSNKAKKTTAPLRSISEIDLDQELIGKTKTPQTQKQYIGYLKKLAVFLQLQVDTNDPDTFDGGIITKEMCTDSNIAAFVVSLGMLFIKEECLLLRNAVLKNRFFHVDYR